MFALVVALSALCATTQAFLVQKTCAQESQVQPAANFNASILTANPWFVQELFPIGPEELATCEVLTFTQECNNLHIKQAIISNEQPVTLQNVATPSGSVPGKFVLSVDGLNAADTTAPFVVLFNSPQLIVTWACHVPQHNNNGANSDQACQVATPDGTFTAAQVTFVRQLMISNGLPSNGFLQIRSTPTSCASIVGNVGGC